MNKKYSLEHLSGANKKKEKDDSLDEAKEHLLRNCGALFITFSQVTSFVLDKSLARFDTVIIDDATLISESDVI